VKPNFDNFFQGMPSLGDIIQGPNLTPDTQRMEQISRSTTDNNDYDYDENEIENEIENENKK
jgi:hypothetical protein